MLDFSLLFPPVEVTCPFIDVWEQFSNTLRCHFVHKTKYKDFVGHIFGVENEIIKASNP